jgi:hypothetical protein
MFMGKGWGKDEWSGSCSGLESEFWRRGKGGIQGCYWGVIGPEKGRSEDEDCTGATEEIFWIFACVRFGSTLLSDGPDEFEGFSWFAMYPAFLTLAHQMFPGCVPRYPGNPRSRIGRRVGPPGSPTVRIVHSTRYSVCHGSSRGRP